ncbi:galactosylgalactosylxylosylprotein 3-beta-glucuronosyltransferase S [Acyrthosiphon pisum]|uniref:Galactosylgalactosylxylosylprotein 3-beta-glucuronosyltransferase n=1 Tax=Acyrthosiphon pisum TaxID=7029 RepID=A0A8R2A4V1_ACYPI|nr:galactosylgalactosylxylosylprotein 3-beta-glucuronosyltransferase S [Acyrthosiphon pisum]XP_008183961.1 galactosylgalactosylxylosylprotein 3-beta-glucuronosyltransferase S [Acyrthosiphon pisum]|eukprot:XP_001947737.1 PREDICTED: galactosylgalactosylxylosylprotein 3-beta-glucuronosyltransferase S [Acyrthosiphon pisum]
MTDRRYSGSCGSSSSSNSNNSNNGYRCGIKTQLHAPSSGRCNYHNNNNNNNSCKTGVARSTTAAMHVKKTWKTAAVMFLAVAAVTTVTAAFYFNYAATACCAVVPLSSSSLLQESSNTAAVDSEPYRSKLVGSSATRPSKLYAVCEVRDHLRSPADRDRFSRHRRQTVDSTSSTVDKNPGNRYSYNGESETARNGDRGNDTTLIYFITPTYPRREQIAELTRLGQTLMHVSRLYWIVADDRPDCSLQIMNLLPDFSIPYTYIASPMPSIYKHNPNAMPRGVSNRRAALNWIRLNHNINDSNAVIYFGDDDNTFHLDLFKEIRTTKKISMFPVGLVGEYGVSSPIIDKGKVVGFFDSWPAKRKFPVDMAGFAINVQLLFKYPYATMPYKAGFEEDRFLSALAIRLDEIEPKAENCTRILVWHTQTAKKPKPIVMVRSKATLPGSLATLLDQVTMLGIGGVSETTGVRSYMTKNGNIFRV